jgi:CubicO group peptidase (beta-lactamase class C family)
MTVGVRAGRKWCDGGVLTLDGDRLRQLDDAMRGYADGNELPGLVWAVARGEQAHVRFAGHLDLESGVPVNRDSIFRISSMTKPVTAVAALLLVGDGRLGLDDPIDDLVPELARRQVLARPDGPLTLTVPAERSITVRDLLTFRAGLGFDFTGASGQAVMARAAELGIAVGPPSPAVLPAPEEYMGRLGQLPLVWQPGEHWLYHTPSDVLGVLVARAAEQPFAEFLGERLFGPLGMVDTGFAVKGGQRSRFGPCYGTDVETKRLQSYDPADGQWANPPLFSSGADGLVSTADDFLTFARLLLAGGVHGRRRLLSEALVTAMTTNQLASEQVSGIDPNGTLGWGFGVGVQLRQVGRGRPVGAYGWDGGLGTCWSNDPGHGLAMVLLTNQMWTSPTPPAVAQEFVELACGVVTS